MSQELTPALEPKRKGTLGEQVRKIADQLQQDTELQIKATSRILGAAAQISENHVQLIREVVDMVEEDLDNQACVYQTINFTVDTLKQQFRTLNEAKYYFGLKANSWAALANKLNNLSTQDSMPIDYDKNSISKRFDVIEGEIRAMRSEISQILFLLKLLIPDKSSLDQ
jgi:ABC-type phosphate transport system auxiliary subunit